MGRRLLTEKTSWDDRGDTLAHVLAALQAAGADGDRDVGALGAHLAPVLKQWDALDVERRERRRAVTAAHAGVRVCDANADVATDRFEKDVRIAADLDTSAPLYRRFFSAPLWSILRGSLQATLPFHTNAARELSAKDTPASLVKTWQKHFASLVTRASKRLESREAAFAEQGRTAARIVDWTEAANASLRLVEAELLRLAATRGITPRWVDGFFPEAPERRPKPSPEPRD